MIKNIKINRFVYEQASYKAKTLTDQTDRLHSAENVSDTQETAM